MKKRIVNALLAGFLLVSATACGKQPAADAAQPQADPTQAYLDTVDVDYAYDLALKLEDIRSNETLGYRTAGSDAELATGDMLKAEMERIGLQNVTKDAFTLDTQDSLFGLSRRCIPSWVSRAHPSFPLRRIYLFIDSLKSGVGNPTPDFLCGSAARAPVGHNLPFVRSRHQAQGQDCNISVFNRFTQINVVSDLFAGFRYKIEHIEI